MSAEQQASSGDAYEGFAVIELMGHRSHGGYVRPCRMYGADMVRVDVPDVNNEGKILYTRYFGGGSIYCLTPCTEVAARAYARQTQYQAPTYLQLPPGSHHEEEPDEEPSGPAAGDQLDDEEP